MRVPRRKPGKFSQLAPDPFMTPGKFNELQKKLQRLKNTRPQAAAEVARLAELGDFSENAEYQLAKWRLRGLNNAILRLEHEINHAVIISFEKSDTVQLGRTVTIDDGDKIKTYQILGSAETDPQKGVISHNSPLGAALMGKRAGDFVTVKLANRGVEYKIVKIE